jgi:hypothetical protein
MQKIFDHCTLLLLLYGVGIYAGCSAQCKSKVASKEASLKLQHGRSPLVRAEGQGWQIENRETHTETMGTCVIGQKGWVYEN